MEWAGLLEQVQEGDGAAWRELVLRFHPTLLRYLHSRGIRSPEDVAADVWLRVHRGLGGLSGCEDEDDFRGWLITIAHHRVVDLRRRGHRRPEEVLGELPESLAAEDPANAVIVRRAVLDAIDALDVPQNEVTRLRLLGGLSHAEIAILLNMTPAAVRKAYSRALVQLREGL
jgi:RNA polymerase sigma-70 factor (ECF subfamily)